MIDKIRFIVDQLVKGEEDSTSSEKFDIIEIGEDEFNIIEDKYSYNVKILKYDLQNKSYEVSVNGEVFQVVLKDELDQLIEELGFEAKEQTTESKVLSPMPGMVLGIFVKEGEEIKTGDKLLILEAMKMENVLKAKHDSIVQKIHVTTGQAIDKNQLLMEME